MDSRVAALATVALLMATFGLGFVGTAAAFGDLTDPPDCPAEVYNGSGKSSDPWEITDVHQLQCMGDTGTIVSSNEAYELVNDIDASSTQQWTRPDRPAEGFIPRGYKDHSGDPTEAGVEFDEPPYAFTGSLDGNGHTIEGLYSDVDADETGLFANLTPAGNRKSYVTSPGTVKNVRFTSPEIRGNGTRAAVIAGRNNGTIKNVRIDGAVVDSASIRTGMVAGRNLGTIRNVRVTNGRIRSGGDAGLVAGVNYGTITNVGTTGSVDASSTNGGGIVGVNRGSVTESYSTASVDVLDHAGGIAGFVDGSFGGSVADSYATGDVNSNESTGGLVGRVEFSGTVERSYATGTVTGNTFGGFDNGGLVGYDDGTGTVTDSYWDTETSGQSTSDGGTGLTTEQMTGVEAPSNMAGFDFTTTWDTLKFADNRTTSYPFLRSTTQSPAPDKRFYADGNGSASNPYEIANWYHLNNTRLNLTANFTVVNDLDETTKGYDNVTNVTANGGKGFVPIGNSTTAFNGTFDGAGYNITNLTIDRPSESEVGLFGRVDGTVTNVSVVDADVTGSSDVGALVGLNNRGTVQRSSSTANITVSGFAAGGLVGDNQGTVNESYATGTVSGGDDVGGLVGVSDGGAVSDSYATADVSGNNRVGGLVGYNLGGTVNRSYVTGTVTGSSNVGILVGSDTGSVTDSYWDVNTTNRNTSSTGTGLVTREMKGAVAESKMGGFDFATTWDAVDTNDEISYPILRNNTQTPAPGRENRYAGGDGTTGSPYEIANWYHLNDTRRNLGANFAVVNDLNEMTLGYDDVANTTANGGSGFAPIGDSGTAFNGTFDGSRFTVTGLYINRSRSGSDGTGLFGTTGSGALIENVGLEDASVNNPSNGRVGGLAGVNEGTTNSSYVTGNVSGGNEDVGGLVGDNFGGTVNSSYATGSVSGFKNLGGLVGFNDGTVESSYATGSVNGTDQVGGLIGGNDGGTVNQSYATGKVSGDADVGGLVGINLGFGTVNTSYATGDVTGSSNRVGGLVGDNVEGTVESSYATGNVSGDSNVGGLVGLNDAPSATVQESYATGAVSGATSVAGLVGENNAGTVTDAYWDVNTTNQSDGIGTGSGVVIGLTTEEMTGVDAPANMAGFNFVGTWFATEQYPVLTWQGAGPLFSVNVTGTNSPINETETLNVTANMTNYGGETGTQTVNFTDTEFENTERDSVSVTLASGESNGSVRLVWGTQKGENGTGNVTVASENTTDTANVTVRAFASFGVNVTGTNLPVEENEVAEVEVNVTNEGDLPGTETVELVADGEVVDNETLTLAPRETQSVTLEWQTETGDGGSGSISVAGADDVEILSAGVDELLDKRDVGRGELDQRRDRSRDLGRGENGQRDNLRRESGRNTKTNRRDRGR